MNSLRHTARPGAVVQRGERDPGHETEQQERFEAGVVDLLRDHLADVPEPSRIFSLIEEHPDSINDGYFLNRFYTGRWIDLPASHHMGGANLAYVDGHVEWHRWRSSTTRPPPLPDADQLPLWVPLEERVDLQWVLSQTSIYSERH